MIEPWVALLETVRTATHYVLLSHTHLADERWNLLAASLACLSAVIGQLVAQMEALDIRVPAAVHTAATTLGGIVDKSLRCEY